MWMTRRLSIHQVQDSYIPAYTPHSPSVSAGEHQGSSLLFLWIDKYILYLLYLLICETIYHLHTHYIHNNTQANTDPISLSPLLTQRDSIHIFMHISKPCICKVDISLPLTAPTRPNQLAYTPAWRSATSWSQVFGFFHHPLPTTCLS